MLRLSFEFRKGIFFVRLIGNLDKNSYHQIEEELNNLITINRFKYIVINTNHLTTVDLAGLNYITKVYYLTKESNSNLVICDKLNIFKVLLNNNVPLIKSELDVL